MLISILTDVDIHRLTECHIYIYYINTKMNLSATNYIKTFQPKRDRTFFSDKRELAITFGYSISEFNFIN